MLRRLPIVLVVAAVLASAAHSPAKEKPLHEHFYIKNLAVRKTLELLETDLVRKEIGLTDAQKAKIEAVAKKWSEAYDKILRDYPVTPPKKQGDLAELSQVIHNKDGSDTVIPIKMADRNRIVEPVLKEADQKVQKQLDQILRPDQLDRIWEIILQTDISLQAGAMWMGGLNDLDKELVDILKLSKDQVEKIVSIKGGLDIMEDIDLSEGVCEELMKLSAEKCREKVHERLQKMRPTLDRGNKELHAVLTPKQRDTLAKMQGKQIDFVKLTEQIFVSGLLKEGDEFRKQSAAKKK